MYDALDNNARIKLSNLIRLTIKGNDNILLSPQASRIGDENIRSTWIKFYSSIDKTGWPQALIDLEDKQITKIGPRSVQKPWSERRESTYLTFQKGTAAGDCTMARSPFKSKYFNVLRPASQDKSLKFIKKSTSSGLPFMAKKGIVLDKSVRTQSLTNLEWPAVLYTRTQEQGKTRDVWGTSLYNVIYETPYFLPALDLMKQQTWLSALNGPEAVNTSLDRIIRYALANDYMIVSVDFTAFDANTRGVLQDCSWDSLIALFQKNDSYASDLRTIEDIFRTQRLVTPDGVIEGEHGTPSGSMFTTPIGSIAHAIAATNSGVVELDNSQILIDDGVHLVKRDDIETLLNEFVRWGLVVNKDKSSIEENFCIYLQFLFHPDITVDGVIKGVYPISRAWNRLCYLERFDSFAADNLTGNDYFIIRALSILENCKYHPAFEELCLMWLSHDNSSMIPSEGGIRDYVDRVSRSQGTEGLLINKYGDDLRGITSWRSFLFYKRLDGKA